MKEIIQKTCGAKWFSVVDLREAFFSIENEEAHQHKTAFEFKGRVYEWNSVAMGYKNSPMNYKKLWVMYMREYQQRYAGVAGRYYYLWKNESGT